MTTHIQTKAVHTCVCLVLYLFIMCVDPRTHLYTQNIEHFHQYKDPLLFCNHILFLPIVTLLPITIRLVFITSGKYPLFSICKTLLSQNVTEIESYGMGIIWGNWVPSLSIISWRFIQVIVYCCVFVPFIAEQHIWVDHRWLHYSPVDRHLEYL